MYTSFPVSSEKRLIELKELIRTSTKTVRFNYNPTKYGNGYNVSLILDVSESSLINNLQNKWFEEDNPKLLKKTFFEIIKSVFKK